MISPLKLRECPHCGESLVADEISEALKPYCDPDDFHSMILGSDEGWICPHCKGVLE
jgi:hypothetical protein|tara:strand:+ start:259 stop:429 length:171 start_codon:yes stop_codon:yes gene_type:complete